MVTTTFTSTHDIDLHGCGESIAAASDNNPAENVRPFAFCSHICSACVPLPLSVGGPGNMGIGPWFKTVEAATDAGERVLTEESYFLCMTGANAKVAFEDPGQGTIYVGDTGQICELTEEEAAILEEMKDLGEEAKSIWDGTWDENNGTPEGMITDDDDGLEYNRILDRVNEVMSDGNLSDAFKQMAAYEFTVNGGYDFDTTLSRLGHNQSGDVDLSQQDEVIEMAYLHALSLNDNDAMQTLINSFSETYDGIRNQFITAEYARIGFEIDDIIGSDGGVNWSLLGGVASDAVGDGIRNDVPPLTPDLDSILPGGQGTPRYEDRERLAEGNRIIYNNIMPHLYGFIEAYHQGGVDDFINNITNENSQGPAAGDYEQVDSQYLRDAFNNLMLATTETDPQAKQELILLSTTQITLFEQSIPEVQKVLTDTYHNQPWWVDTYNFGTGNNGQDRLNNAISMTWDGFSISAGKDVPPPDPDAILHSPNLINWKGIVNPELWDLISDIQTRGGSRGTEADDWHDLYERMYFISATLAQHGSHQGMYTMNQRLLVWDSLTPQRQNQIRNDQIEMLDYRIQQLKEEKEASIGGVWGTGGGKGIRLQNEIDALEAEKQEWENMDIPDGLPKLAVVSGATLTCPKAVMGSDVKFFMMNK